MPIEQFQRYGSFFELREEFRKQALQNLRKREGLPTPELIDGKMQYLQPDGSYSTMATGTRKGAGIDEAEKNWGSPATAGISAILLPSFEILEVSEDGKNLQDELNDLNRDAKTFQIAERVSHGSASQQAPDFELDGTSDEEVDSKLQEYLKREVRGGHPR